MLSLPDHPTIRVIMTDINSDYWDTYREYLNTSHILVFYTDLSHYETTDIDLAVLSSHEHIKKSQFVRSADHIHFIKRRYWRRRLLANILNTTPQSVHIEYDEHGKPYCHQNLWSATLQISASSSLQIALLAIALDRRLGIDIQHMDSQVDILGIASTYFSPHEFNAIQTSQHPDEQLDNFYSCWVRKEAWIKANGIQPLHQFSINWATEQIYSHEVSNIHLQWNMCGLNLIPNYRSALVYEKRRTPR